MGEVKRIIKRLKRNVSRKKNDRNDLGTTTFESKHSLSKLKLFIIIVNYGQADAIIKKLESAESGASFTIAGQGTGSKDIYEVIGLTDTKKQVILTITKEENTAKIKNLLENRFKVSRAAKGVAFSIKMTSIVGVVMYRYLANMRFLKEKDEENKNE